MKQRKTSARWGALSQEERKEAVIDALQAISSGGRGVSQNRWDGAKPRWMPGIQTVTRLFGSWSQANIAAGLKPNAVGGTRVRRSSKFKSDEAIGEAVERLDKRAILDAPRRPLVVVCSDEGQPYRYYDPNLCGWRCTTVYRDGRFDNAAPR